LTEKYPIKVDDDDDGGGGVSAQFMKKVKS
jgi:hypothetical protein